MCRRGMRGLKVLTVVGARPQFIKASVVSRALRQRHNEILVHTGQHYDHQMSQQFFDELGIPKPDINLEIAGGTHAEVTARMMVRLESVMSSMKLDYVLLYGDTNSTLAGALAASKLNIPIAHVEAGVRSYDNSQPEEINRLIVDSVAYLKLCPTRTAAIRCEGDFVGDVMYDLFRLTQPAPSKRTPCIFATIHRASNVDNPECLKSIVDQLNRAPAPVILPLHPRSKRIADLAGSNIDIREPMSYKQTLEMLSKCSVVVTDSGGLQKEAYWSRTPCITVRPSTEWTETLMDGANVLSTPDRILHHIVVSRTPTYHDWVFGSGDAAKRVVAALETNFVT